MNILTRYECGCCKTQYADRDAALKCELNHKCPVDIKAVRYLSFANDSTGYPVTIMVRMGDGHLVTYKRQREV